MSSSPYHGNQLGAPDVDCDIKKQTQVKAWSKPYPLPGGEAVYYGVSLLDGGDQILVPFNGNAIVNFNSTFSEGFAFKYMVQQHEEVLVFMNDVLDIVFQKIKMASPQSDLEKQLSTTLDAPTDYPRKDGGINAKLIVKSGIMVTTFGPHADFDAFKKKAMVAVAKKKPVAVTGMFLVQGAVLSNRGLDVCVKLWDVSVRK